MFEFPTVTTQDATLGVFGIGTVVLDHVVVLPQFPRQDTKTPVLAQWQQVGGPVPVALSTAAYYGTKCAFAGNWGLDAAGDRIQDELHRRGVDLSSSQSDARWTTGFAHVWTEEQQGTRTIAFTRGNFPEPPACDIDCNAATFRSARLLHTDGSNAELAARCAIQMKQQGGVVILDAGSRKPSMDLLLRHVDLLIASDLFCQSWFGTNDVSLEQLRDLGADRVIHTQGDRGAWYFDGKASIHQPAMAVEAIDTNGAGDIFCGAILHAIANRWNAERTLRFATAVAGYACQYRGNSSWPSMSQLYLLGIDS